MSVKRPTFHESWYRVRRLRPCLRTTVQTYRQHFRGRPWHVIQDSSSNQHFRVDDARASAKPRLDAPETTGREGRGFDMFFVHSPSPESSARINPSWAVLATSSPARL